MRNKIYIALATSALLLASFFVLPVLHKTTPQAHAQPSWNAYLTIDGVQGGDSTGGNNIEIASWSWGATQSSGLSNVGGSGKVSMQDLHFTKRIDGASSALNSLSKGKRVKNAVLTVSNGTDSFKMELTNVMVSSYGLSSSGGDTPTESVTLNFTKLITTYDLKENKK